jgi:hypothetical protein
MPPEFRSTPVGSRDLLAQHGLVERRPPVRSSDFRSLGSPFHYYLTRKLGLVPALRYSVALSQGTWFHAALEILLQPGMTGDQAHTQYKAKLEIRMDELRNVCTTLAMGDARIREILATEEQDATSVAEDFALPDLEDLRMLFGLGPGARAAGITYGDRPFVVIRHGPEHVGKFLFVCVALFIRLGLLHVLCIFFIL